MPANIRVRCQFLDCEKLNGVYCGSDEVAFDPKEFCLTYTPIEVEEVDDIDEEFDEDESGEEEDWLDEEDDEVGGLASLTDDD